MTDIDHARLKELFIAACDLAPDEQEALIDEECRRNPLMGRELRELLKKDAAPSSMLAEGQMVIAFRGDDPPNGEMPASIGQYTLLRRLGVGGMGVVWLAEQAHPRRTVALKIVNPGLVSPDLIRRFEFETSVLARLQHPGIAQIYDAGTFDDDGSARPYFAMEHIDGAPLNEHIARAKPSVEDRLKLFIAVCEAVHHAHQKGVVHRDLKPGNMLVTPDGAPKILDFGVARAIDSDMRATVNTSPGQVVGTLAYMSPEQVNAATERVDIRSDVYALGVNLYETLAGRLPYDLSDGNIAAAARVISEHEPVPLASVDRSFRGDLNTIALKALEKDPGKRYQSASDLAADVQRFLDDAPILARPATTIYQLRKFARRNRGLMMGGATALFALVAGVVVATVFAIGQSRALAESEYQRSVSMAINEFLTEDLLELADPQTNANREVTLRESLDQATERLEGRFDDAPLVEASIRKTVGKAYRHLGEFDLAEHHLGIAYELYRAELGETDEEALLCRMELAALLINRGENELAQAEFESLLTQQRALLGEDDEQTIASLHNLGVILIAQGKFAEAEPILDDALARRRRVLGEDNTHTATTMNNLAAVYQYTGRLEEAGEMFSQALDIHRRASGAEHPDTLRTMYNLGAVQYSMNDIEAAAATFEESLAAHREVLGEEHPGTLQVAGSLAVAYGRLGETDKREELLRATLPIQERVLGPQHMGTLVTRMNLAKIPFDRGDFEQAEREYAAVAQAFAEAVPGHFFFGISSVMHGRCLTELERFDEAEAPLLAAHQMFNDQFGPDDPRTRQAVEALIDLYERSGNADQLAHWR